MGTNLRTTLAKSNPYYISKHRRLELTHFCLQYPEWEEYLTRIDISGDQSEWSDPTCEEAIKRMELKSYIELIETCCHMAGNDIYEYLFRSVTKGESYTFLSTKLNIPCSRDYFYDRQHKFFYILSQKKHMF